MLGSRRIRALFELALTVAVAVGLALAVQAWAVKPYKIPSSSMEPTLTVGQRVLVDRLFFSPHVGQIFSEGFASADPDARFTSVMVAEHASQSPPSGSTLENVSG